MAKPLSLEVRGSGARRGVGSLEGCTATAAAQREPGRRPSSGAERSGHLGVTVIERESFAPTHPEILASASAFLNSAFIASEMPCVGLTSK